ncbi:MAG: glycosyltransferase [Acidobacteriota bacterium]
MIAQPGRVLFVAYAFPPVGGAGVQRVTKFVKYLPDSGWQASVLTVSNPSVPVADSTLEGDVPAGTLVRRARTFEPSYATKALVSATSGPRADAGGPFRWHPRDGLRRMAARVLQPDPQVLWFPSAVREGRRLLRAVPHTAIVATAPPFSSFLVGLALHRTSGLPLVLDYRDEWDLTNAFHENKRYGRTVRQVNRLMERSVVRRASLILATSDASVRALETVRDRAAGHAAVVCLRNGFDPEDFDAPAPPRDDASTRRYRVVYTGTLWEQTSVEPLVRAARRLCTERPDLASRLELVIAGLRTSAQEGLLQQLSGLPVRLVAHSYLGHRTVVQLMRSADLLCSLTADLPGAERFLNAKIFEYMASRRPILAIAPPGDLWDLLSDYPASSRYRPSDVGAIFACLARKIGDFAAGRSEPPIVWDGRQFDRRQQAWELGRLLADVSAGRQPHAEPELEVCPT